MGSSYGSKNFSIELYKEIVKDIFIPGIVSFRTDFWGMLWTSTVSVWIISLEWKLATPLGSRLIVNRLAKFFKTWQTCLLHQALPKLFLPCRTLIAMAIKWKKTMKQPSLKWIGVELWVFAWFSRPLFFQILAKALEQRCSKGYQSDIVCPTTILYNFDAFRTKQNYVMKGRRKICFKISLVT